MHKVDEDRGSPLTEGGSAKVATGNKSILITFLWLQVYKIGGNTQVLYMQFACKYILYT